MEFDTCAALFLQDQGIRSVRRLTTTTVGIYGQLVQILGSPVNMTDIDQIDLFHAWYAQMTKKIGGPMSNDDLICELNAPEWDNFCCLQVGKTINTKL